MCQESSKTNRMDNAKSREAGRSATIPVQHSSCGKWVETFILSFYWGTSALDYGLEAVGFEVVARICGGLRVGVGPDLDAIILVRAGGDDVGGKSFLLQGLGEGHGVTFALDGRDLEHDGSVRDQRRARRSGIFRRRRGLWRSGGRFPARRAAPTFARQSSGLR